MKKQQLNVMLKTLRFGLNLIAILAATSSFLAFLGSQWWIFQILDHLRVQLSLILLLAILLNGIKYKYWSLAFSLPFVLNLSLILPLFIPSPQYSHLNQRDLSVQNALHLLHINLDVDNNNYTTALQYIEQQNADLIFLQEVTPTWFNQLESHLSNYQIIESRPLKNTHGVALLLPNHFSPSFWVQNTEILHFPAYSERPMIATQVQSNPPISILSIHLTRPRNKGTSNFQQIELDAVAAWSQEQQTKGHQVIIIGDYNLTPWSIPFRRFLKTANLRNSQRGFGLQPTWFAGLPPFMMIAIDHAVYSEGLMILDRKTGSQLGSDHLPLWLEVTLKPELNS